MNSLFKTITGSQISPAQDAEILNFKQSELVSQCIHVQDLILDMMIGVYDSEKSKPQRVIVDMALVVTPPRNWREDELSNVLSYDVVINDVKELAIAAHYHLVETFAEKILERCFNYTQTKSAKVTVRKPDAIKGANVGISIERKR